MPVGDEGVIGNEDVRLRRIGQRIPESAGQPGFEQGRLPPDSGEAAQSRQWLRREAGRTFDAFQPVPGFNELEMQRTRIDAEGCCKARKAFGQRVRQARPRQVDHTHQNVAAAARHDQTTPAIRQTEDTTGHHAVDEDRSSGQMTVDLIPPHRRAQLLQVFAVGDPVVIDDQRRSFRGKRVDRAHDQRAGRISREISHIVNMPALESQGRIGRPNHGVLMRFVADQGRIAGIAIESRPAVRDRGAGHIGIGFRNQKDILAARIAGETRFGGPVAMRLSGGSVICGRRRVYVVMAS